MTQIVSSYTVNPISVLPASVYTGSWRDYSKSPTLSHTYTTTNRNGSFLVAFIALYISLAGACTWKILSFLLHRCLSQRQNQDAIYHQRQVVLRNSANFSYGLWNLGVIAYSGRKHKATRLLGRVLPIALLSTLLLAAFSTASVFSSWVATTHGQVLLESGGCTIAVASENSTFTTAQVYGFVEYDMDRRHDSSNYGQLCYAPLANNNSNPLPRDCSTYPVASLNYNITRNSTCPFPGQGVCREGVKPMTLDSGYINSHFDLGINAPPEYRYLWREVLTCVPLNNDGFESDVSVPDGPPFKGWSFGKSAQFSNNYTFLYPNTPPVNSSLHLWQDYSLKYYSAKLLPNGSFSNQGNFKPISAVKPSHGDVYLIFLSTNDVMNFAPVKDPWFSATTFTNYSLGSGSPQHVYVRDDVARVLGCVESYQMCKPGLNGNNTCSPLTSVDNLSPVYFDKIWTDPDEQAYVRKTSEGLRSMITGLETTIQYFGSAALKAHFMMFQNEVISMPENQWELEVEGWFQTYLADVQRIVLDLSSGLSGKDTSWIVKPPNGTMDHQICSNQRIRNTSYTSFSILGIVLVLVLGGLIIILGYTLPVIVERMDPQGYKSLEWRQNETLEIQRLAHENRKSHTWKSGLEELQDEDKEKGHYLKYAVVEEEKEVDLSANGK
ncbi:hypothetical protein BT63DRAFT_453115 [Microthyrium microscopicum]|uniref:Uncharacterized protein n=1 Tax=Microthyrium microscopicum TaxID=703497 RepID=A0A6A6UGR4_9PEZI|nr:hypothetical protein BT63DRAFT_453115 [Microthyrium microscopicum]